MPLARNVTDALLAACQRGDPATLAVVVASEGSTYVRAGAMALFAETTGQVGWLSGGCLEPEIARQAAQVRASGELAWMCIDTRDDAALFSGAALGCRGQLQLALLPLAALPGVEGLLRDWQQGVGPLYLGFAGEGVVEAQVGVETLRWEFASVTHVEPATPLPPIELKLPPPPAVCVLGAGPECESLLPQLRALGWRTTLVETRPRWQPLLALADEGLALPVEQALARPGSEPDAALLLHHDFERDREALLAAAATAIPFIGLLGPVRRREDLFALLPESARASLQPRLHAPIGLDIGGEGPEAIALSIAAQLQAWRHGRMP